jgi:hypothetical protein
MAYVGMGAGRKSKPEGTKSKERGNEIKGKGERNPRKGGRKSKEKGTKSKCFSFRESRLFKGLYAISATPSTLLNKGRLASVQHIQRAGTHRPRTALSISFCRSQPIKSHPNTDSDFQEEIVAIVSLGLSMVPPTSADFTIREDGVVTQSGVGAESYKCRERWNIMSTYKLSRDLVVRTTSR